MSGYRCMGCGHSRRRPEYRRVGLGSVCSNECFNLATRRPALKALDDTRMPAAGGPDRGDIPYLTRALVLSRDAGRCRYCGRTSRLQQHHISYRSEGVDHSPHNLILLCGRHHELIHTDKRHWQSILRAYIWLVYVDRRRTWLMDLERLAATNRLIEETNVSFMTWIPEAHA